MSVPYVWKGSRNAVRLFGSSAWVCTPLKHQHASVHPCEQQESATVARTGRAGCMLLLWLIQPAAVIVIGQVYGSHSMALGSGAVVVAYAAAFKPADTIDMTQQQR